MRHKISGIYAIENKLNGHRYIGSSIRVSIRFSEHRFALRNNKHFSQHLQAAWNKYGESAFEFRVLEEVLPESLKEFEQLYIDTLLPEYNIQKEVVRLGYTHKHSEETKQKLSKALVGNTNGKNGRGRKMSEESKEKMRQAKLGIKRGPMSEETKQKISNAQKGKPRLYAAGSKRSEETKQKMSAWQKGKSKKLR